MTSNNPIDLIRTDAPALADFGTQTIGVRTMIFSHVDQIDILAVTKTETPINDRDLTVEIWYPAAEGTEAGTTYDTGIRDSTTPTTLSGPRQARAHLAGSQNQEAILDDRLKAVIIIGPWGL